MSRPRYHIIYINTVGRGEKAYSISIENHYQLVIELWCRYVGRIGYRELVSRAVEEATSEYVRMGLGDYPYILALPRRKKVEEMIMNGELEASIKCDAPHEVMLVEPGMYRRGVELASWCLKRRLEIYPPRKIM